MPRLFMLLIGCKPPGRHTEQHDIFFGIGESVKEIIPAVKKFWPETGDKIHLDGWREVNRVNGYTIQVVSKEENVQPPGTPVKLFFINLGGYKPGELEEFHYKMLVAAPDKGAAINEAKQSAFYKHTGFEGANSHIDDKYGVDVDDMFEIEDILPAEIKDQFQLVITKEEKPAAEDELHLGYFKLSSFT